MATKQFLYIPKDDLAPGGIKWTELVGFDDNWVKSLVLDAREKIKIKTEYPVIGMGKITGYSVKSIDQFGNFSETTLNVEFRCAIDAIHFSEWAPLTDIVNVKEIKHNHPVVIEYLIENPTYYKIDLLKIELYFDTVPVTIPDKYLQTCWSDYLDFYDRNVLLWAVNVLNKVYKRGVVANYIKRGANRNRGWEDKDYIDFWWTVIHLVAFRIYFSYHLTSEILYRKDLLIEFLKQRNIFTSKYDDLGELYYLANNYYNEIRRRGTFHIFESEYDYLPDNYNYTKISTEKQFDKNVKIKGELLRLLGLKSVEDLELYYLGKEDCGWYVGTSCPTYTSPTHIKGYVKKVNYPIFGNVTQGDIYTISSNSGIGTIKTVNAGQIAHINPNIAYEITFFVKKTLPVDGALTFGVSLHDDNGNILPIKLVQVNNEIPSNLFFSGLYLARHNDWYFVRGIIYDLKTDKIAYPNDQGLNVGVGNHLKFVDNIEGIVPFILWESSSTIEIKDLKIRPAFNYISDYLSQVEKILILNKNVSREYNDDKLQDIIDKFLIDYGFEFNYVNLSSGKTSFIQRPYLILNKTSLSFNNAASSQIIELRSNIKWEIKNIPSWITFDKTSGENDASVRVTVTQATVLRTVTITFQETGNSNLNIKLEIEQAAATNSISVIPNQWINISDLGETKEDFVITVSGASTDFNIINTNTWIITGKSGNKVRIQVLENPNVGITREATVELRHAADTTKTATILLKQEEGNMYLTNLGNILTNNGFDLINNAYT